MILFSTKVRTTNMSHIDTNKYVDLGSFTPGCEYRSWIPFNSIVVVDFP